MNPISRRTLLKSGAGAAALWMAGIRVADAEEGCKKAAKKKECSKKDKKIPVGLQLYSIRRLCGEDLPGMIEAVAKMGYQGVEFAGYHGRTAEELRKMLDGAGLECCGSHIHMPDLQPDKLKETVEFNQTLGNPYLVVAGMPGYTQSAEAVKERADFFSEVAAKVKPDGMMVGYHAHGGDFKKIGDEFAWDLFFDATSDDVIMQMDVGNCIGGGGDPLATLKRFPKRSATIHLKEHGGDRDAVIGDGDVPWKDVFEICEATGGTEWYIVEHERGGDALKNVERCLDNIREMGR